MNDRLRAALRHSPVIPFGLIVFIALGLRLLYLAEIRDLPLIRAPVVDSRLYYEWAGNIAAGDWRGDPVFYQAPGYAYFLAGLRALVTNDLLELRILQAFLGAVSCGLLFLATSRLLDRPSGIAAGFLLACSAPAIFFDGLLHKPVLMTFLAVLLLLFLGRAQRSPRVAEFLMAGWCAGLLAVTSENTVLLGLVIPLWIWFRFRDWPLARRIRWMVALLLGIGLMVAPVTWHNVALGHEFVLVTSNMGPNLYIGNHPGASGTYEPLLPDRQDPRYERQDAKRLAERARGRPLSAREVSDYWAERAGTFIHQQPLSWLELLAKKGLLVWNDRELTDADDFYLYRERSWVLRALDTATGFGCMFALAAFGGVLTWRHRKELGIVYAVILTLSAAIAVFFVFARYRFVLVPFLLVLAGGGVAALPKTFTAGRRRRLAWPAVAFLAALGVSHLPVAGTRGATVSSLVNLSIAALKLDRFDEAAQYAGRALALDPDCVPAMYEQAKARRRMGDSARALQGYERVLRRDPDHAGALLDMGLVCLEGDRLEEARSYFSRVVEREPDNAPAQNDLAIALSRLGRYEEARPHVERAIELDPDDANARVDLGAIKLATGDVAGAIECFTIALRLDPGNRIARLNLSAAQASPRDSTRTARTRANEPAAQGR